MNCDPHPHPRPHFHPLLTLTLTFNVNLALTLKRTVTLTDTLTLTLTLTRSLTRSLTLTLILTLLALGVLTGEQLEQIGSSLVAAQALVKRLRDAQTEEGEGEGEEDARGYSIHALPSLFDGIPMQAVVRKAINEAVDEYGSVRDSAQPSLGDLRFAIRELSAAARAELNRMIQSKGDALATRAVSLRDER